MNQHTKDKIAMWIAWHLPRWLVYWCAIRLNAHATQGVWGNESPNDISIMDALGRWDVSSSLQLNSGDPFVE